LAKEPGARYQTAAALSRDLGAVARAHTRLRRSALVAAVLALVAALGVVWTLMRQRQPEGADAGRTRIMLAVLPFANESGDPDQDYLSDGLTDELITELGRLHPDRLGVIAHTSTVRYQRTGRGAADIRRKLGVDYFIEGSAARVGSKVRIGVRLARARDQTQIWADRYERDPGDVPMLHAYVARAIARQIAMALPPEQRTRLDAHRIIDPEAYQHYLKGRYFWNKRTEEGLRRAAAEFEAAAAKHPGYAAAHAGLADSYLLLAYYAYMPPDAAFARARSSATTALQLDRGLAEAHVSLAGIYDDYDHRWEDARAEYREALRLNANYPTAHQWYANHLIALGHREEAQARILRARELDPLSLIIQVNVANIFLLSRDYERVIEECRKAIEMEPGFVTARWVLGRAFEHQGRFKEAIGEFHRALAVEPESTLLAAALARVYAVSGARAQAESMLAGLLADTRQRYVSALDLALVHAALGRTDDAFAWLERAVRERPNLLIYAKVDPAYDCLRDDARFSRFLRTMGLD
jgi:TolB-like protein/Tfp pilus assembly protein PilF